MKLRVPHRHNVRGPLGMRMAVGQLQARQDKHSICPPCALGLVLDLTEEHVEVLGAHRTGVGSRSTWSVMARTSNPARP